MSDNVCTTCKHFLQDDGKCNGCCHNGGDVEYCETEWKIDNAEEQHLADNIYQINRALEVYMIEQRTNYDLIYVARQLTMIIDFLRIMLVESDLTQREKTFIKTLKTALQERINALHIPTGDQQ